MSVEIETTLFMSQTVKLTLQDFILYIVETFCEEGNLLL